MDVLILGAGIVGLSMATLLAQDANLNIGLIETKLPNFDWDPVEYDLRCSAINRATQNVFRYLDVWDKIVAERVGVFEQMHIWSQTDNSSITFNASDSGTTELGHIIENRLIQRELWNKLKSHENIKIINNVINKIEKETDFYKVYFEHQCVDVKLIIGADGANSWLRNYLDITTYGWDYKQAALVATIKSQLAHNNTALQCFTAYGPLAFLPLDNSNLSSIVWSSSPDRINILMQSEEIDFCSLLAKEFDFKLGALELQGKRASFPLRMMHAKNYVQERIALIGDAAHVTHPLLGQGLNLGVLDAAALAEIINFASLRKLDIGRVATLRKYERWRKSHNLAVIAIADGFKHTYDAQSFLVQSLRGYSMRLANDFTVGKRALISFAMGLAGDLPKIAQCY